MSVTTEVTLPTVAEVRQLPSWLHRWCLTALAYELAQAGEPIAPLLERTSSDLEYASVSAAPRARSLRKALRGLPVPTELEIERLPIPGRAWLRAVIARLDD